MNQKILSIFVALLLVGSLMPMALADDNQFTMLFYWNDVITTDNELVYGENTYLILSVYVTNPVDVEVYAYKDGSNTPFGGALVIDGDWDYSHTISILVDSVVSGYTPGDYEFIATVSDANGNTESIPLTLTITEAPCDDADGDGVCDEDEVFGCTDADALNYDPLATENDGSCIAVVEGCMDPEAENYNSNANVDDGSCIINTNDKPEFHDNLNYQYAVNEMQTMTLAIVVVDDNANSLTANSCYTFLGFESCFFAVPEGIEITESSENHFFVTWTPGYDVVEHPALSKDFKLRLTAYDGELYDFHNMIITVNDVNQIPDVLIESNTPINEGEELDMVFTATDLDEEDELQLGADNFPAWAEYNLVGNQIFVSGTPDCGSAGVYVIDFAVTDGYDMVEVPQNFQVLEACSYDVPGCTNPEALNYNPDATIDDGSCEAVVEGCMNPEAVNYNPLANVDDGSCEAVVLGCMDPEAVNYNPLANVDDGSCDYVQNQPPHLTINGPSVVYEGEELSIIFDVEDEELLVENVEVQMEECILFYCYNTDLPTGAEVTIVGEEGVLTWTPDYTFVIHPDTVEEITFVFIANDGEFVTEQEITVNVIDVNRLPELDVQTNEPFEEETEVQIVAVGSDADEEDELSYEVNNVPSWLSVDITEDVVSISGVPPCDAEGVYEIEITVTDGIDIVTEIIILDIADACNVDVLGCTDSSALNYNPLATVDDGSCIAVVEGCMDPSAFNYNPLATVDDGSCEAVLEGCTDPEAANYNPNANVDDGSCVCIDLDNDGICDNEDPCVDQDGDGICDPNDACPLEAEDYDGYLDEDGCPESHNDANIASVHLNSETLVPGDYLSMYIRMSNDGDTSFSDMRAEAIVYAWGEKVATGEFNLHPGQEKGKHLVMQVPYHTQPGDYLIKVTMEDDYYHESMYRLVTIY